jgi:hypothetical protein
LLQESRIRRNRPHQIGGFACHTKEKSGEPHWTRTSNQLIKSQLLCQLS